MFCAAQKPSLVELARALGLAVIAETREEAGSCVAGGSFVGERKEANFLIALSARPLRDGGLVLEAFSTTAPGRQLLFKGLLDLPGESAPPPGLADGSGAMAKAPRSSRLRNRRGVELRQVSSSTPSLSEEEEGTLKLKASVSIDGRAFESLPVELLFRPQRISLAQTAHSRGGLAESLAAPDFDPRASSPAAERSLPFDGQDLRACDEERLLRKRLEVRKRTASSSALPQCFAFVKALMLLLHTPSGLSGFNPDSSTGCLFAVSTQRLQAAPNDAPLLELLNDFALLRLLKRRLQPREAFAAICAALRRRGAKLGGDFLESSVSTAESHPLPGPVFRLLKVFVNSLLAEQRPLV